jgi:hypothetical protein
MSYKYKGIEEKKKQFIYETYHNDIHHLKLKVNQISSPFKFNLTNIKGIKTNEIYLLSLLIFSSNYRLQWERNLFRQHLTINRINSIRFLFKDVCKLYFNNNNILFSYLNK